MSFCSLIKRITLTIHMLCFVLINSILFNLLHVWRMKLFEIIIINKVFIKCKLLSTEIIPSAYACTHIHTQMGFSI